MKIKSLKRLPYKIFLLLPFASNILLYIFNRVDFRLKKHLWDMVSTKPPVFLRRDAIVKTRVGDSFYLSPLRVSSYEADWNLLFSIGHDVEIKNYYLQLIQNSKPDMFIDIGANYGLHSAIFAAHHIKVHSIEPNPECVSRIRYLNQMNDFKNNVSQFALGSSEGSFCLRWPHGKTWLGEVVDCSQVHDEDFSYSNVNVRMFDSLNLINSYKTLIKIDVEGFEINVLRGAEKSINEWRPKIVFESISADDRSNLYNFFDNLGYEIQTLDFKRPSIFYTKEEFVQSRKKNFLALSS